MKVVVNNHPCCRTKNKGNGCIHKERNTYTKKFEMQPNVVVHGHTFRWNKHKKYMYICDFISRKLCC